MDWWAEIVSLESRCGKQIAFLTINTTEANIPMIIFLVRSFLSPSMALRPYACPVCVGPTAQAGELRLRNNGEEVIHLVCGGAGEAASGWGVRF